MPKEKFNGSSEDSPPDVINGYIRFKGHFRIKCSTCGFMGAWRKTKDEAAQDIICHKQTAGNQNHDVKIITCE